MLGGMSAEMSARHIAGALAVLLLPIVMGAPGRAAAQADGNTAVPPEVAMTAPTVPARTCEAVASADTPFRHDIRSGDPETRAGNRRRADRILPPRIPGNPGFRPAEGDNCFRGAHDEDPFPRTIEISFSVHFRGSVTRTDKVAFTATKRKPCSSDGSCYYDIEPDDATVSMAYVDRAGCHGTASGPPFSSIRTRTGFGPREENGSYPFDFSVTFTYHSVRHHCDDGTSGSGGVGSSNGRLTEWIPWVPTQRGHATVPVSAFPGGSGDADIYYRY